MLIFTSVQAAMYEQLMLVNDTNDIPTEIFTLTSWGYAKPRDFQIFEDIVWNTPCMLVCRTLWEISERSHIIV